jgi:two-component system CheB/CheR fusion protein
MEVETATAKKIDIELVSSMYFIGNQKNLQFFIHEIALQE